MDLIQCSESLTGVGRFTDRCGPVDSSTKAWTWKQQSFDMTPSLSYCNTVSQNSTYLTLHTWSQTPHIHPHWSKENIVISITARLDCDLHSSIEIFSFDHFHQTASLRLVDTAPAAVGSPEHPGQSSSCWKNIIFNNWCDCCPKDAATGPWSPCKPLLWFNCFTKLPQYGKLIMSDCV